MYYKKWKFTVIRIKVSLFTRRAGLVIRHTRGPQLEDPLTFVSPVDVGL